MTKAKIRTKTIINILIAVFFIVCVIAPLVSMLCNITVEGFRNVVHSELFGRAVFNSITTSAVATFFSVVIALLAAWSIERVEIKFKKAFSVVFVLPMLIPSISHAFGLVALFGQNGLVTNLLHLNTNIYGFWGIVVGSIMYSFPVAYLMFSSILQYEDGSQYKAAKVLGIGSRYIFLDITLSYLRKTIISATFAVFTMVITDYGVPLMIGGKTTTLSVLMFNKAVSMIDYDSGSVIGAFLLIPAVVAFILDLVNPDNGQDSFVSEPVEMSNSFVSKLLSYLQCVAVTLCILAPIAAFCVMTFETKYPVDTTFTTYHIEKTLNRGADEYFINSLIYSILAASFGTVLAFVCSYLTARLNGKFSKGLHLISMTSMSIPGMVLGLSYVIFFHNAPIYGTIIIVALVNSIHFFASPYLMMYNTLAKVNPNIESVGATLGVNRLHIIVDVIIPKVKGTIGEMFSYFFVNSMMTISAVSFLAPPSPKALSLMINQFEAQRLMESAAFVSIIILLANVMLKIIVYLIKSREKAGASYNY